MKKIPHGGLQILKGVWAWIQILNCTQRIKIMKSLKLFARTFEDVPTFRNFLVAVALAFFILGLVLSSGCTSTAWTGPPMDHPTPSAYVGDAGMTSRLHHELCGSYFNEVDGNMQVVVRASQVYDFIYSPRLIDGKLIYTFEVWIADPRTDYLRAVSDIMSILDAPDFPPDDRGKLNPGLFYDRRHSL